MKHCCDSMEKCVTAEGSRIRYDAIYQEYDISVIDKYQFLVFFCPFCGTKTPDSRRTEYFLNVTDEEECRLLSLVVNCATRTAVINQLGEPDWQSPATMFTDPIWRSTVSFPHTLLYKRLSQFAELRIVLNPDETIQKKEVSSRCIRAEKPG